MNMESIISVLNWVMANYQVVLSALVGISSGLIAIFLLIPGEQPEKALQGFVDFISKFSKK